MSCSLILLAYLLSTILSGGFTGCFIYAAVVGNAIRTWYAQNGTEADALYARNSDAYWARDLSSWSILSAIPFGLTFIMTSFATLAEIRFASDSASLLALAGRFFGIIGLLIGLLGQLICVSHIWGWPSYLQAEDVVELVPQARFLVGFFLVLPCLGGVIVAGLIGLGIGWCIVYLIDKRRKNRMIVKDRNNRMIVKGRKYRKMASEDDRENPDYSTNTIPLTTGKEWLP